MASLTTVNIGKDGLYVKLQNTAEAFKQEVAAAEGLFGSNAIKEYWGSPEGGNGLRKASSFKFCPSKFTAEEYEDVLRGNIKSSKVLQLWWSKKGFRSLYWKLVDDLGENPGNISFDDDKVYNHYLIAYSTNKGKNGKLFRAESSGEITIKERPKFANNDCCFLCPKGTKFKTKMFGKIVLGRHHCKACGKSLCTEHCSRSRILPEFQYTTHERVCDECFEMYGGEDSNALAVSDSNEKDSGMFGSFKTLAVSAANSAKKHAVRAANEVVNISSDSKPAYRLDIMNLEMVCISQMESVTHGLDLLFRSEGDNGKVVYTFDFQKKIDKLAWGVELMRLADKYKSEEWKIVQKKLLLKRKTKSSILDMVRSSDLAATIGKTSEAGLSKLFNITMDCIGDKHGWLQVVAEGDLHAIMKKAKEIQSTGQNLSGIVDYQGCTALHYACWLYKPVPIIRYLMQELKCDPNTPMLTSLTCVHFCAWKGHIAALKEIVECKDQPGDLFKTTYLTKSTPKTLIQMPYPVRKPFGGCDSYVTEEIIPYLDEMERLTAEAKSKHSTLYDYLANRMPPEKEGFFLSHFQMNAGPQVMNIRDMVERFASKESGIKVWLDKDEQCTENGMKKGVREQKYFLLFLTDGYFTRPFCRLEVCEAIKRNKTIVLVNDMDCTNADGDYVWDGGWPVKRNETNSNMRPLTKGMESFGGYIDQCKNADWEKLAKSEEYGSIFSSNDAENNIMQGGEVFSFLRIAKLEKYSDGFKNEGYEEFDDLKSLAGDEKSLSELFKQHSFKKPEQQRLQKYLNQLQEGTLDLTISSAQKQKPLSSAEFAQNVVTYIFNNHKSIPFYSCSGDFAEFGRASIKSIFEAGKYDGCGAKCYSSDDNIEIKDFSGVNVFILSEGGYSTAVKNNLENRIPSLAGKVNISSEVGDEALKYINAATHCVLYLRVGFFLNKTINGLVDEMLANNKNIILVHDTDTRQGGSAPGDVTVYKEEAGALSERLFTTSDGSRKRKVIPYCTEGEFRKISIQLILKCLLRDD